MFDLRLTSEPLYYDEHRQPCYAVSQDKGLSESQDNRLLEGALAEGYTAEVAETLLGWIRRQVSRHCAGGTADILEIGGGDGAFFEHVKEFTRTYVNIEPGRHTLSGEALGRVGDGRYMCVRCSAEEIPLPDESVDVIISIASLDHVPDYRRALAETRRLLRKGGIFILTLNNRRSWWKTLLSRTAYLKRREAEIAKEHHFQWSFDECGAHLSEFIPVSEMRTTTYIPFIPKAWKYLLPASDVVGKTLLPGLGANIIAVCEKPR
ncbi:MAG TPA: class I SAM-dependent methyltransferase [Pyrinomonadaceae bacterium]